MPGKPTYEELEQRAKDLEHETVRCKLAENELAKSEEKYRLLVENSVQGVLIIQDLRFVFANSAISDTLGYSVDEMLSFSPEQIRNVIHPDHQEVVLERFRKRIKGKPALQNYEFRAIKKDGTVCWVEIYSSQSEYLGKPAVQAAFIDITEKVHVKESLKDSEQRYRSLFEDSKDAIYITKRKGPFIDVNSSALDLFGYTREEMIGMDVRKIYVNQDERNRFQHEIEKKGSVRDYEIKFAKKDSRQMNCLLTSTLRRAKDGSILGYQGVIRDVSEQKQLEAQLLHAQKMEAVGTLTGGIAHDFNNILQAISGFVELLEYKKDRESIELYLPQIGNAANRASELTKQLLIFSRKVESKLRPVNINEEVINVYNLLRRTIPKMIDIELKLAHDIKIANADPIQFEQVVMNLGVNAKDAMPDGGKMVIETKNDTLDEEYTKLHMYVVPGEYIVLNISDTGHGMDKETLEHIFEPFYTTKEIGKGTGLGLSMCYGIVKNHNGYIFCNSKPDRGTVFKIYLPVLETCKSEHESKLIKEKEFQGGHETILLVDDVESLLEIGKAMLEQYGYAVITAASGERAIEIYKKEKESINLVILDIGMPGIGGHNCLSELKNINPEIKVLVASGYVETGKMKETLACSASGFIAKPYRSIELIKKVRCILDKG